VTAYNTNTHAWLLHGGTAAEREKLAGEIAAAAVCRGSEPPCGICPACVKAAKGLHPDIIRVEREEDKASILVRQIRALGEDAAIAPNEADRKVYIVPEADKLNPQAQNAFLKLLEEPPKGVCFVLCAASIGSILPTVLSRCTRVRLRGEEEFETSPLLSAVARGSEIEKITAALSFEKLDRAATADALTSLWRGLADEARRAGDPGERERLAELADFTADLREKAAFLSSGSVSGLLAAKLIDSK
jgi:DNA polymerase III gamma/tau subunit